MTLLNALGVLEQWIMILSGLTVVYFGILHRREARFYLDRLGALFFILAGFFLFLWKAILWVENIPLGSLLSELAEGAFAIMTTIAIQLYLSAVFGLYTKKRMTYQAKALEEAQVEAVTDAITGLYNHRAFQKQLEDEIARSKRYNQSLSLLMIDLDHFKTLNDTYGHPMGDAILREVGQQIKQGLRNIDYPARYGGEEFAVILPETSMEGAKIVAERLRYGIFNQVFRLPNGQRVFLSISIGVACFPVDAKDKDGLIETADKALYFAKQSGRNRVGLYGEMLKSTLEKDRRGIEEILRDSKLSVIRNIGLAIDAKTPYTFGHTDQVVRLAMNFAKALRLSPREVESLRMASLLHNIGLINAPENVLNKPGPLTLEERKIIQAHPTLAEMLLKDMPQLEGVLPAILYHHERWDGNGYPRGLRAEEIPYLARILAIAESYHAMISARPYRRKLDNDEAIEQLNQNSGSQFDPQLVVSFIQALKEEGVRK